MGRGDKKSKKGKLWRGSYGNNRLRTKIKLRVNGAPYHPSESDVVEGSVDAGDAKKKAPKKRVARKKAE